LKLNCPLDTVPRLRSEAEFTDKTDLDENGRDKIIRDVALPEISDTHQQFPAEKESLHLLVWLDQSGTRLATVGLTFCHPNVYCPLPAQCLLPTSHCPLSTAQCQLFNVHNLLPTAHCPRLIVHCSLSTVYCPCPRLWPIVHCLSTANCPL
jgi:hypothetical protein